ncbi:YgcG family protein, partial [Pseudomonas sp. 21615526]|uniref:TPM domain-containing protein n=1 Tax=Pseudomonas sp. 21615526 TaxID=2738811 RepID=UPI0015B893D3
MMVFLRQCVLGLLLIVSGSQVWADTVPPAPVTVALDQRVIDLTQTLDAATQSRMTTQLAGLEQRKGAQVAVMLLPSTQGVGIEDFANQLFRAWKLGRKDVNDGILLLVAKDDRKVRIEVGYGLEGVVTDLLAHRIIEEHITPAFRQGDYAGGVQQAVDDLTLLVDGGNLPEVAKAGVAPEAYAVLLAFMFGGVVGVLMGAEKLPWRRALMAVVGVTVVLVAVAGGKDWPVYLLLLPLCMLIGGATFGALWQARAAFYTVLVLLGYIAGVLLTDNFVREISLIHWLAYPFAGLLVLGLYLGLFLVMKSMWQESQVGFIARLLAVLVVYGIVGALIDKGATGWLLAFPFASFAALFIFAHGISGGSGSGGGSSSSGSSSSSSSSSSGGGGS